MVDSERVVVEFFEYTHMRSSIPSCGAGAAHMLPETPTESFTTIEMCSLYLDAMNSTEITA